LADGDFLYCTVFRSIPISIRVTAAFFIISFTAVSVVGFLSYIRGKESLQEASFSRLTLVREIKADQIEEYFHHIADQALTFAEDHTIIEALKGFTKGFQEIKNEPTPLEQRKAELEKYYREEFIPRLDSNIYSKVNIANYLPQEEAAIRLQDIYISSNPFGVKKKHMLDDARHESFYSKHHSEYHPYIRKYLKKFGFYDIFLIDSTGNIVYTVFKEVDFGTSLENGPYKKSQLAHVYHKAKGSFEPEHVVLDDYAPYDPSYNAHAAFVAAPIREHGHEIGVLVFQLPIDRINDIMTNRHSWQDVGLGKTGETYIVGEDFTLRNQSRFLIEDRENYLKTIASTGTPDSIVTKIRNLGTSIGLQTCKTIGTENALRGEKGTAVFPDYRGVNVLSAYQPLKIKDLHWVLLSEIDEDEAFNDLYALRKLLIIEFISLLFAIGIISYLISRHITLPLKKLTQSARQLAKGDMETPIEVTSKDEIGILALSFKKMQLAIHKLFTELKEINAGLEEKVKDRTREIQHQKEMVEEKNKEILDSILYAKRLQNAILPPMEKVKEVLPDSFILFKPKDIVSGDFYWMEALSSNGGGKLDDILIAAVDCTGHGVPGAMVSVVGSNGLNRSVKEFGLRKPSEILDNLRSLVEETFSTSESEVKDGMDIALCRINTDKQTVHYSGAHNPLWILRKDAEQIEEIRGDKQPIGKFDYGKPFSNHEFQLAKGDCIFFFTDGFSDQFGGSRGKKFRAAQLMETLLELRNLPMEAISTELNNRFETWKGNLEQIDDVCVIGVRF